LVWLSHWLRSSWWFWYFVQIVLVLKLVALFLENKSVVHSAIIILPVDMVPGKYSFPQEFHWGVWVLVNGTVLWMFHFYLLYSCFSILKPLNFQVNSFFSYFINFSLTSLRFFLDTNHFRNVVYFLNNLVYIISWSIYWSHKQARMPAMVHISRLTVHSQVHVIFCITFVVAINFLMRNI